MNDFTPLENASKFKKYIKAISRFIQQNKVYPSSLLTGFTIEQSSSLGLGQVIFWVLGVVAGIILLWLLFIYIKKQFKQSFRHEQFLKNRSVSRIVQNLSGTGFEIWVEQLFLSLGAKVKHIGKQGDHGIDLEVEIYGNKIVVQCKKYYGDKRVGEVAVRDLYGVLHGGGYYKALLITTGQFTWEALAWAKEKPGLVLVNEKLLERIILNSNILKDLLD